MFTVTKLAQACNISRATVLYYEREGLLNPALRAENGYRWYGEKELNRLHDILRFRSFGIPVAEIQKLIAYGDRVNLSQSKILRSQFEKLEQQISELRKQQSAIVSLLKQPALLDKNLVSKEDWVAIMRASGLNEDGMTNWHKNFEKLEPAEHQLFLESLGLNKDEIAKIRAF